MGREEEAEGKWTWPVLLLLLLLLLRLLLTSAPRVLGRNLDGRLKRKQLPSKCSNSLSLTAFTCIIKYTAAEGPSLSEPPSPHFKQSFGLFNSNTNPPHTSQRSQEALNSKVALSIISHLKKKKNSGCRRKEEPLKQKKFVWVFFLFQAHSDF